MLIEALGAFMKTNGTHKKEMSPCGALVTVPPNQTGKFSNAYIIV